VLDPDALYELDAVQPHPGSWSVPVLVHALGGFVDAGQAGRLAVEHLLATLPHRVLVRFDVDQLYDYRARRPIMTFTRDHWESYDAPRLELSLVEDATGTGFLMLTGPEPDIQWERFTPRSRAWWRGTTSGSPSASTRFPWRCRTRGPSA
jgi:hypothetical protein